MIANANLPVATFSLYARIEPTCDAIVQRYAEQPERWCDIAYYRDADAAQPYARRCACLRARQQQQASVAMLNCFVWHLIWLGDAMEVRDE